MILVHASAWMFHVLMVGFAIAGSLSAMSFDEMNRLLGAAVVKAMIDFDNISPEMAAHRMGMDRAQFEKALRGESYRHLSLNHLIKLGPDFMGHLARHLMWLTAQKRYLEIVECAPWLRKQA